MRQPKAWSISGKQFGEAQAVGKNIDWPSFNFGANPFVEVLDLDRHEC